MGFVPSAAAASVALAMLTESRVPVMPRPVGVKSVRLADSRSRTADAMAVALVPELDTTSAAAAVVVAAAAVTVAIEVVAITVQAAELVPTVVAAAVAV